MKRVCWDLEEAVVLFDLYFRNGKHLDIPEEDIARLSQILIIRGQRLGWHINEKFRNISGLRLQLACIHFVVTDGAEGMANASKLFYETYDLIQNQPDRFEDILHKFYQKYTI